MPDPQTPNLQLYIPLRGADVGTWDTPANANSSALDSALGGTATVALTNVNVTLSAGQYACGSIVFTGALGANIVVTFPPYGRSWILRNNCTNTNTYSITCQVAGVSVVVPPPDPVLVVSDGTDMRLVSGETTGQSIVALAGANVTLTPAQYEPELIVFNGALAANLVITFPPIARSWILRNDCTNTSTFSVTCHVSGTSVVLLPPASRLVASDGTDMRLAPREVVNIQTFTATGVYTPSSGMVNCIIECVGGGGGGSYAWSNVATLVDGGGGGGSGGYSRKVASAATIGASQVVTVGFGGASRGGGGVTSVGALCIANGGAAGGGTASGTGVGAGGLGGVAGTGDVTATGGGGENGFFHQTTAAFLANGGMGGASFFGSGGRGGLGGNSGATSTIGGAATAYGAGGGGGGNGIVGTIVEGGAGKDGIVIITEHCLQ